MIRPLKEKHKNRDFSNLEKFQFLPSNPEPKMNIVLPKTNEESKIVKTQTAVNPYNLNNMNQANLKPEKPRNISSLEEPILGHELDNLF